MKPIVLNKKSWHYRLAHTYGGMQDWEGVDICSYSKNVLFGFMITCLIVGGASAVLGGLGSAIEFATTEFLLQNGFLNLNYLQFVGTLVFGLILFIVGFLGFLFGMSFVANSYNSWRYSSNHSNKEPGFIRQAYSSWKNQYCRKIEFK